MSNKNISVLKEGKRKNYSGNKYIGIKSCQRRNKTVKIYGEKKALFEYTKCCSKNSFFTVSQEWLEIQRPQLKISSFVKYNNILNLYLLPYFSERQISEIESADILHFSGELLKKGGANKIGLAPKTVSGIISVLKSIFRYAEQIKEIPVANLKNIAVRLPQKPMRVLSRCEQERLNKYLYENLNPSNLGILVCLYTGLRIGEICALKWGDISFDEQCLYVRRTMQRLHTAEGQAGDKNKTSVIISEPKSDCSIRKIPIQNNILNLLKKFRKPNDAYILTGIAQKYIEPRTVQNHFKSVIKSCHIEDINFHSLRHTFATRCIELGFDIKSLSEILGHASVNITLNRYVHPSMQTKQKNMDMLSELFAV